MVKYLAGMATSAHFFSKLGTMVGAVFDEDQFGRKESPRV